MHFQGRLADVLKQSTQVFNYDQITQALDLMAAEVSADLRDLNPLVLTVMQGGLIFSGHMLTRLSFPLEVDYVHASRYRGEREGGGLRWLARPASSLEGRHVLLLDDIFDQGFTLEAIAEDCMTQGAASVRSSVLLSKRHERPMANYQPEYSALEVDDWYVYGFGMDFEHQLRNLNAIYAYHPEV